MDKQTEKITEISLHGNKYLLDLGKQIRYKNYSIYPKLFLDISNLKEQIYCSCTDHERHPTPKKKKKKKKMPPQNIKIFAEAPVYISNLNTVHVFYDDIVKWKHFLLNWPFVRGFHRSPFDSPHKDQWRGALMFSLICAWTNGWANNRDASDLRRHRTHYDVTLMFSDMLRTLWPGEGMCAVQSL